MNTCAIIVAAGQGHRFNDPVPKQFHNISGKPLIYYSLKAFFDFSPKVKIILVLNKNWMEYWEELCKSKNITIAHEVVEGGENRSESVHNALKIIEGNSCVMIHDAVRPCLSINLIQDLYNGFIKKGNAVPSLPITNALRKVHGDKSEWVDRSLYYSMQTPQVFRASDLKDTFHKNDQSSFIDESEMMDKNGMEINLISADPNNIKITYPLDIQLASLILQD